MSKNIIISKNKERDHISDSIYDLCQMEILGSEEVYACNVCNEGFDTADEVKKHIEINHNDVLIQINKTIAEEEESEDDEAFYFKHGFLLLFLHNSHGTKEIPDCGNLVRPD